MNRRNILSLSVIMAFGFALLPGSAAAQQKTFKEQLTGTWTVVSNDSVGPDGTKRQLYGPSPKGILIFVANGQFANILVRPDLPNFKGNRLEGTLEENRAVVHGTNANFGTWSVDEANKILILRNEGSTFPNDARRVSKRPFTLAGDELRVSNPTPGSGGKSESVYRRAK